MICTINGKELSFDVSVAVTDLLADKKLDPNSVVIELNGEVLPREKFSSYEIREGDNLELLSFVGGG
jgi:sulfur carrier protein